MEMKDSRIKPHVFISYARSDAEEVGKPAPAAERIYKKVKP